MCAFNGVKTQRRCAPIQWHFALILSLEGLTSRGPCALGWAHLCIENMAPSSSIETEEKFIFRSNLVKWPLSLSLNSREVYEWAGFFFFFFALPSDFKLINYYEDPSWSPLGLSERHSMALS